jgi:acyl carrier protein
LYIVHYNYVSGMVMGKTQDVIINFIKENYIVGRSNKSELNPDESLLESGIMDSTGILELVLFLEEQFLLEIQDEEIIPENLDTINNIVAFVEKKKIKVKS